MFHAFKYKVTFLTKIKIRCQISMSENELKKNTKIPLNFNNTLFNENQQQISKHF